MMIQDYAWDSPCDFSTTLNTLWVFPNFFNLFSFLNVCREMFVRFVLMKLAARATDCWCFFIEIKFNFASPWTPFSATNFSSAAESFSGFSGINCRRRKRSSQCQGPPINFPRLRKKKKSWLKHIKVLSPPYQCLLFICGVGCKSYIILNPPPGKQRAPWMFDRFLIVFGYYAIIKHSLPAEFLILKSVCIWFVWVPVLQHEGLKEWWTKNGFLVAQVRV